MFKTLINVRSQYTFLNSLIDLKKYINFAIDNNLKYLSIADFNMMYSTMEFYNLCINNKIKPIIGINCNFIFENEIYNFNLIAKNYNGYKNLCKISSILSDGKVDLEISDYEKYFDDLILIININKNLNKIIEYLLKDINKEDLYFGLIRETNKDNLNLDKNKIVFNYEVNYLNESDFEVFKCVKAIKEQKTINEINEKHRHYFSVEEINNLEFEKYNNNLNKIYEKINLVINKKPMNIYQYKIPNNISPDIYLKNICINKLKIKLQNKNKNIIQKYLSRLNYELDIIKKKGFINYFLIVSDYVNFAKQKSIMVGPGRGSAASSLVSYLLGITMVDPIKYDLLFERFLNPERSSMPDIDIDFEDVRRIDVLEYLFDKYGKHNVATIVTFQRIGIKSAIRDFGRIFKIDLDKINNICKKLTDADINNLDKVINDDSFLAKCFEDNPKLFIFAKKFIGFPRQVGTHAAGIIISNTRIDDFVPTHISSIGLIQVQYAMNYLEYFGLIKMDLLGLRNLSILNNIIKLINKKEHIKLSLENISLNNLNTFKILQEGYTKGIFQLESKGMINVLKKMQVNSLNDIIATSALYRPGPMKNIDKYINNKFNFKNIKYINENFKDILKSTYGIIVFQEQVMLIAQKFASFSLAEADILRSAISKKQSNKMDALKIKFFKQANLNNYSKEITNDVWKLIYKFTEYGFNKAHAVSYSLIGYWLAFFKANYPGFFFAAVFSSSGSSSDLVKYLDEIKLFNLKLISPSINIPILDFSVEKNNIYIPISYIKGINNNFLLSLRTELKKSHFKNIYDFFIRMQQYNLKQVFENLVYSGALDIFKINRTTLIKNYALISKLFFLNTNLNIEGDNYQFVKSNDDINNLAKMEKKYLGFYLKYNPFIKAIESIKSSNKINEIIDINFSNYNYYILAQIEYIKIFQDKRKKDMAFVTVKDKNENKIDITIFSDFYNKNKYLIEKDKILLFKISFDVYNNKRRFKLIDIEK